MELERIVLIGRVVRQVREVRTGVRRHEYGATIRAAGHVVVLVVLVRPGEIDGVGVCSRRDVDIRVVRALRIAESKARVPGRVGDRIGEILPRGGDRRGRSGANACRCSGSGRTVPPPPTPTYMRVSPFGSFTTSNSARSVVAPAGPSRAMICSHVPGSPFDFERQIPRAKNEAYTVFGSTGSIITRRAPRGRARRQIERDVVRGRPGAQRRVALVDEVPRLAAVRRAPESEVRAPSG